MPVMRNIPPTNGMISKDRSIPLVKHDSRDPDGDGPQHGQPSQTSGARGFSAPFGKHGQKNETNILRKDNQDRYQRARMKHHVHEEDRTSYAQNLLHHRKVTRTADGKKLRQTLQDAEQNGF